MFKFFLKCTPRPIQSVRFNTQGRAYQDKWVKDYIVDLKAQLYQQAPSYLTSDPVALRVTFYKNRKPTSKTFGDIDNLLKGLLDAMKDLIFKDDSQIVSIFACKKTSTEEEGIRVELDVLQPDLLAD